MTEQIRIDWYRCEIDRNLLRQLMARSNSRGLVQAIGQLLLYAATGTIAWVVFRHLHASNWPRVLPLFLGAVFFHGTIGSFLAGTACHELCHKTPFRSPRLNEFFLKLYAFLGWFNPTGYRLSHSKHHQVTLYTEHDGEVVVPLFLDWTGAAFILSALGLNPKGTAENIFRTVRHWVEAARGEITAGGFFRVAWLNQLLDAAGPEARREHRAWARTVVLTHLALAIGFVATGNWILIVIFTFGGTYCGWLAMLCGAPQHAGLAPNAPDFRLSCRTYTCGRLIGFLYWNMQYHVEHHMFPAVPFYNLPRLRAAIEADLPPAPHGLRATWKELLPIMRRQRTDPTYVFIPKLPRAKRY